MYQDARFLTLTGHLVKAPGACAEIRKRRRLSIGSARHISHPRPRLRSIRRSPWRSPEISALEDKLVMLAARKGKGLRAVFPTVQFTALYDQRAGRSPTPIEPERADWFLLRALCHYTGGRKDQITRLFLRSALGDPATKDDAARTFRKGNDHLATQIDKVIESNRLPFYDAAHAVGVMLAFNPSPDGVKGVWENWKRANHPERNFAWGNVLARVQAPLNHDGLPFTQPLTRPLLKFELSHSIWWYIIRTNKKTRGEIHSSEQWRRWSTCKIFIRIPSRSCRS